jgi:hypothetical protein
MAMQIRKFGWLQPQQAWKLAQAWRHRNGVANDRYKNGQTSAGAALVTAQSNLASSSATLAAEASLARIKAAGAAKTEAGHKAAELVELREKAEANLKIDRVEPKLSGLANLNGPPDLKAQADAALNESYDVKLRRMIDLKLKSLVDLKV